MSNISWLFVKESGLEIPCPFKYFFYHSLWWGYFTFGLSHRWSQAADDLQIVYENLTGDVLVSAGVIAYLGAFTSGFRQTCTEDWSMLCKVMILYFISFFLDHSKYKLGYFGGKMIRTEKWRNNWKYSLFPPTSCWISKVLP